MQTYEKYSDQDVYFVGLTGEGGQDIDKIRGFIDEFGDVFLVVDGVFAFGGTVGHADGHAHVGFVAPAADIVGGAFRFEIEAVVKAE